MSNVERYEIRHWESSLSSDVLTKYKRKCFVETGSNIGAGIQVAIKCGFEEIHSIEYFDYFESELKKFRRYPFVNIYYGDSASLLKDVCPKLKHPTVFYLDGHAINYNPLLLELEVIRESRVFDNDVILIDDVRMFGNAKEGWGGITDKKIRSVLMSINKNFVITYEDTMNASGDLMVAYVP